MKTKSMLTVMLALLASVGANASNESGNGGGAWVCQNSDNLGTIRWARLVDLYEGRTEFGLNIPEIQNREYLEIADTVMVRRLFPVSEDLYRSVNEKLETVKARLVMVNADLAVVNDSLYRIQPARRECLGGTISYVQLANFTNDHRILIQQNLFNDPHLSETDKAALLIHEAVYAYLRDQGDENSVRTRKIVGLLFSTLPQDSLRQEMETILGGGLSVPGIGNMQFVQIRPGSFMMGSPEGEADRYRNERLHLVQLTNGFEMQTTSVTQKQYFDVMGVNPSRFKDHANCPRTFVVVRGTPMCPNNPVEQVSYDDVQLFLSQLNAHHGNGYFYRLPTEAEWEYAARAGTSMAYSFGNDPSQLALYGWFSGNSGNQTHEVGQLRPNGFGLYDMHGNVWQWVQDLYADDYGSANQINPTGAASGPYRVFRGGSWGSSARALRSANRSYDVPAGRGSNLGFRLVRTR